MILEGVVTTLNGDGVPNISPMGPHIDGGIQRFVLKPYRTSRTYANLKRLPVGVFHITDDVELLARAAVDALQTPPAMRRVLDGQAVILSDACRWYAFRVTKLDDDQERTRIECQVTECGRQRDFLGFNRAKHAVVEAAILATRTNLLPRQHILDEFCRLLTIVEKTAGEQERRAFDFLHDYVCKALGR